MIDPAGERFPFENAILQRHIAMCGAVFRDGDRSGVEIEVVFAERLPRGHVRVAVQEDIAGAERGIDITEERLAEIFLDLGLHSALNGAGSASITTTMNRYVHVTDDSMKKAVAQFAKAQEAQKG